jgi:hypothetical protein
VTNRSALIAWLCSLGWLAGCAGAPAESRSPDRAVPLAAAVAPAPQEAAITAGGQRGARAPQITEEPSEPDLPLSAAGVLATNGTDRASDPSAVPLTAAGIPNRQAVRAPFITTSPYAAEASDAENSQPAEVLDAPLPALDEAATSAPMPMFGAMLLVHVKDYAAFREVFDQQLEARKQAGFVAQGIMRGYDDPKLVAIWMAVTDVARAKAFFGDKARRDRWSAASVQGRPEVRLWSNVDARMEPGQRELVAAVVLARVREFSEFKTAFNAEAPLRSVAGVVGYSLSQDVDDKQVAHLYFQGADEQRLRAYLAAKETKQTWRDAGVRSARVTFVQEGELSLYP